MSNHLAHPFRLGRGLGLGCSCGAVWCRIFVLALVSIVVVRRTEAPVEDDEGGALSVWCFSGVRSIGVLQ